MSTQCGRLSQWMSDTLAQMEDRDNRAVLAAIFAYLAALVSPHVCNRFYLRELYNTLSGTVILGCLYNWRNLLLIGGTALANLGLAYLPVKEKDRRGRYAVYLNVGLAAAAYGLRDPADGPLLATLTALFMKYFYLATEYRPLTDGVLAYWGYLTFTPGLRYGPVLSYGEYQKWLSLGYLYALEGSDPAVLQQQLADKPASQSVADRKEELVLLKYYQMTAVGLAKFIGSTLYLVLFRRLAGLAEGVFASFPGYLAIPLLEVLALPQKYLTVAWWWSEETLYLTAFINGMNNVNLRQVELSGDFGEMCRGWNTHGSEFMHRLIRVFYVPDPKQDRSPQADLKEYLGVSLLSYGHLLWFPESLGQAVLALVSLLSMGLVPDFWLEGTIDPSLAVRASSFMTSRVVFSYFMLTSFVPSHQVLDLWRCSLGCGHFLALTEALKKVAQAQERAKLAEEPPAPPISSPADAVRPAPSRVTDTE